MQEWAVESQTGSYCLIILDWGVCEGPRGVLTCTYSRVSSCPLVLLITLIERPTCRHFTCWLHMETDAMSNIGKSRASHIWFLWIKDLWSKLCSDLRFRFHVQATQFCQRLHVTPGENPINYHMFAYSRFQNRNGWLDNHSNVLMSHGCKLQWMPTGCRKPFWMKEILVTGDRFTAGLMGTTTV